MNEGTAVNGFTGIVDLTDFGIKSHVWTLEEMKKYAEIMNVGCLYILHDSMTLTNKNRFNVWGANIFIFRWEAEWQKK